MRLIDADILKEAINTYDKFACLPNCKLYSFRELEHPKMFIAYVHFSDIIKAIDNAPTVEIRDNFDIGYVQGLEDGQKRPQGKWIKQENKKTEFFCSECGRMIDTKPFTRTDNFPFCHCGADMRGDKE